MRKDTALYVGDDQRQRYLGQYLEPLGIELHRAPTVPTAKEMLQKQSYDLALIQYKTVRKQIFDFYSFIRHESPSTIIMVLMAEARPKIESKLFDYGIDDVVAGVSPQSFWTLV